MSRYTARLISYSLYTPHLGVRIYNIISNYYRLYYKTLRPNRPPFRKWELNRPHALLHMV
ncbi:hypothetical protein VP393E501_P0046 [Vibrio phage 393E50-1]|nr:hypothetical protein VP393E501_P0046 [Vibrio phage 393E50-1]